MNRASDILIALSGDTIAYKKVYTTISGSLTAGVLLSQLLYWRNKLNREFWITNEELCEQTGLTIDELKSAKKRLLDKGFITIEHKSLPRKTYYIVNVDEIVLALTSECKSPQLVGGNSPDWMVEIPPTTSETTTKTTTNIYKQDKKTKVTLELEEFVSTYNATYKRNIRVPSGDKGWVKNFKKWREDYSLEQILEAVVLSRKHQFYGDKLTPDMLLRTNEDRIALFLNAPKPKTREQLEQEEFHRLWENAR
jgi:hypothetical protein